MRKPWFHIVFILSAALMMLGDFCQSSLAGEADSSPVYQRYRHGQTNGFGYGNQYPVGYPGYGFPGFGNPGYGYFPPVINGSWYARPYPYHFDYYRQRFSGAYATPRGSADCPCAARQ